MKLRKIFNPIYFFSDYEKDAKLRRNLCKKFFANGKWSKFSNLRPKFVSAVAQHAVFGIFSSILLNMSQLTVNFPRYSSYWYDMSSRHKAQNTHEIASNLQILFNL